MIGEGPIYPSYPFDLLVSLGRVPGYTQHTVTGANEDVDSGTEDVWQQGGVRTLPTSAGAVTVVSSDAADDEGSTGAEVVTIEYLDANYAEQTLTVTLNGISNVASTETDVFRINKAYVSQAGSGRMNAGNITCTVDGNVQCQIPAGLGQSQEAMGTVPAGKQFVVNLYKVSMGRAGAADTEFNIQVREFGTTTSWKTLLRICLYETTEEGQKILTFPAKSEFRVQCQTTGTNVFVSAALWGMYVTASEFA